MLVSTLRLSRRCFSTISLDVASDAYWAEAAQWYNKHDQAIVKQLYHTLIPFLNLAEARRVIDIEAGVGEGAELLLKHTDPQTTFVLTHSSAAFVEAIQEKALERCECVRSDPAVQAYPGEFFDLVLGLSTMSQVSNPFEVFREAYRLLSPTGIMAFSVLGRQNGSSRSEVLASLKSKLGVDTPSTGKKTLNNPGKLKATLKHVGFRRIVAFSEHFIYPTRNLQELKQVFLEEPLVRQLCNAGRQDEVEKILEKELHQIVEVEGAALNHEALLVIAAK